MMIIWHYVTSIQSMRRIIGLNLSRFIWCFVHNNAVFMSCCLNHYYKLPSGKKNIHANLPLVIPNQISQDFTFSHLANTFIQSDLQVRDTHRSNSWFSALTEGAGNWTIDLTVGGQLLYLCSTAKFLTIIISPTWWNELRELQHNRFQKGYKITITVS